MMEQVEKVVLVAVMKNKPRIKCGEQAKEAWIICRIQNKCLQRIPLYGNTKKGIY